MMFNFHSFSRFSLHSNAFNTIQNNNIQIIRDIFLGFSEKNCVFSFLTLSISNAPFLLALPASYTYCVSQALAFYFLTFILSLLQSSILAYLIVFPSFERTSAFHSLSQS